MDTKICRMRNIEKNINNFYKKYSECKDCNRTRGLKRYYENKDRISNQKKTYYEKNGEGILIQKKNNRCLHIKESVLSYVELENRFKAMEKKFKK